MKRKLRLVSILSTLLLISCKNTTQTIQSFKYSCGVFIENSTIHLPLNTSVVLVMYDQKELKSISSSFEDSIFSTHKLVDSYNEYENTTNVFTINSNLEKELCVDEVLFDLIKTGKELTKLTKGKLNILLGSVIDIWKDKFDSIDDIIKDPDKQIIKYALDCVPTYEEIDDYLILNDEKKSITLYPYGTSPLHTSMNLGAISKGYALDIFYPNLETKSALLSAGSSSIHLNGEFPSKERKNYIISLTEPLLNKSNASNEIFASINVDGGYNISTSGDYNKFFINEEGILRNHILDSTTGYSTNYHAEICVISKLPGVILDGLSTALSNIESLSEIDSLVSEFEKYYEESIAYTIIDRKDEASYVMNFNEEFSSHINNTSSRIIKKKLIQ